jgi:hypothetical protein
MAAHAKYGASHAPAYTRCYGAIPMTKGRARRTSRYAAEGTAAHEVLEMTLTERLRDGGDLIYSAQAFLGRVISADGFDFEVDEEMVECVDRTADAMLMDSRDAGMRMAEQRVVYGPLIGLTAEEGFGTSDFTAVETHRDGDTVFVDDFKYGRGVKVYADNNEQMMLYALGVVHDHGYLFDAREFRLRIHQPRLDHFDEWVCSFEMLSAFAEKMKTIHIPNVKRAEALFDKGGAEALAEAGLLQPGEKQCKFCDAKGTCPAARALATEVVGGGAADISEFTDLTAERVTPPSELSALTLGAVLDRIDFVEEWCTAARAEAERRLLAGEPVVGYKLVEGKRGNRAWAQPDAVTPVLTKALGTEAYGKPKLITPTQAEKVLKAKGLDKLAAVLLSQDSVTQTPGKPHVAPERDRRPALARGEAMFQPVSDDTELPSAIAARG